MVINKSAFLVLVLVSSGLLCSGAFAYGRDTEQDPRRQYEECQRRCEQSHEQDRCEQMCERQFRKQQKEQDPRQQFEKCQRRCEWETHGEQEQQQCERKCERHSHDMNPEDPQTKYQECQKRCERQETRQQRPQCQQRCQQKLEKEQRQVQQCQERCERQEQGQQEKQQCQRRCQRQSEEEQQSRKQYQQCQERCQEQEQGKRQQQQCQRECREEYQQETDVNPRYRREREGQEQEQEEEEQQRNNPFFFPSRRSFQTPVKEQEGEFRILQRFAEKSRRLFKGDIDNFRFVIWKANPNTFVLPHHTDSEAVYFVTNGKGTITFVTHENKESYNVERGHVVRIPAGCTVYMVNQDNQETFTLVGLASPVNTPGKSEIFFPAGNENPQSYFQVFSDEILETVFNTPREKLEEVFEGQSGQQRQREQRQQGLFRRASREQIREMTEQATSPRRKTEERLVINLLGQSPVHSNQNGRCYEACPDKFQQLRNMDVSVSATEINEGAILVPHYNTEATIVVFVKEGNGRVEMACPHLSQQSQGRQTRRYQEEEEEEEEEEEQRSGEFKKVRAQLSTGDVFVVPAGHPVTFVASKNQKLKLIGFGINARNNQRIFLAGKKNMVRQMDSAAKEISFGVPAKQVDEVFNNPNESYFMSSSSKERQERMGNPLSSILDFARLF